MKPIVSDISTIIIDDLMMVVIALINKIVGCRNHSDGYGFSNTSPDAQGWIEVETQLEIELKLD